MSACPHFLRGTCRYGDRCRNSHVFDQNGPPRQNQYRPRRPQINPAYNYVAPGVANRNHHVVNTNAPRTQNLKYSEAFKWIIKNFPNKKKALDILDQIQTEARMWERSEHLWKFTSRSLFPGGAPLPDWVDQSFEEVRWAHRYMTSENQYHVYKKGYYDYITKIDRQIVGLIKLRLEALAPIKGHLDQFIDSNHQPSKTLLTDIEMRDVSDNTPPNMAAQTQQTQSTNYTPEDDLFDIERRAFESDSFEFGEIPMHAPPQTLS